MEVGELVRRLVRRRLAVVAVVVVAVVAAAISWGTAGTSQQSGAAVVIVPPPLGGSAAADENPLLNLDNNLAQLATVLSSAMNSPSATRLLQGQAATAPFTISTVTGSSSTFAQLSPQLVFTVTGSSSAQVERTAAALVSVARDELTTLQNQADVPGSARATLVQVVAPTPGEAVGGGRLRSAGTIGLAIVVLGLLAVLAVDELIAQSARRRARAVPPPRPATRRRRRAAQALAADPDAVVRPRSR